MKFLDNLTRERLEAQCRKDAINAMDKLNASASQFERFNKVVVKYHARRTSSAGTGSATEVTINLHLNDNEAEFIDTMMHEFAHSICFIMYGNQEGRGHGYRWKSIMLIMGREPKRCHDIDLAEAYPDKYRKVVCSCGKVHNFSRKSISKVVRRGTVYLCECKAVLNVLQPEERQVAARVAHSNTAQLVQPFQLVCTCGWTLAVTKRRFNLVLKGKVYTHKKCGGHMRAKQ